ncbi:MAG: hypothetical protein LC655_03085 [Bacteroidales bacterium]|nr:hypothetical protein [Bacteroidales bacterium]
MFAIAYKVKLSDEVEVETLQQLAENVSSLWAFLIYHDFGDTQQDAEKLTLTAKLITISAAEPS